VTTGGDEGAHDVIAQVLALVASAAERLDELAYDLLVEALGRGERERPELERRVVRARNALERAAAILRRGPGAEAGEP